MGEGIVKVVIERGESMTGNATMETIPHMPPGMLLPQPEPTPQSPSYFPIGGWLLLFGIVQAIYGVVEAFESVLEIADPTGLDFGGLKLGLVIALRFGLAAVNFTAAYSVFRPTGRAMQVLRYYFAGAMAFGLIALDWKEIAYFVIWGFYFMRSKRVMDTYGENLTIFGRNRG